MEDSIWKVPLPKDSSPESWTNLPHWLGKACLCKGSSSETICQYKLSLSYSQYYAQIMKNRKIHLPKLLSWQKMIMMSGHHLEQLNTVWSWNMNNPSPGKDTGIHPRDLGAEPRDGHQSCCCPRIPCNEEFAQANREKSFFIPQSSTDLPTNLSLSYSRAEPMAAAAGKSSQTTMCKAWG